MNAPAQDMHARVAAPKPGLCGLLGVSWMSGWPHPMMLSALLLFVVTLLALLASQPSSAATPDTAAASSSASSRASTDALRDLTLTARGGKLFQVEGREVYVYTERCRAGAAPAPRASASAPVAAAPVAAAPATSAPAPAASSATPNTRQANVDWLRFADGRVCRVRGVFGVQPLAADRYGVQVAYRERDWYEAVGTDMFLRTRRCMHLTLGEKGVLVVMAADDMRLLFADGGSCEVQAAFSRLKS